MDIAPLLGKDGKRYCENVVYRLPEKTSVLTLEHGKKQGKSEPWLRDYFGMEKPADDTFDALLEHEGTDWKVEIKDFDKNSKSVRGGADCRESVGQLISEYSQFLRIVQNMQDDQETFQKFKEELKLLYRGTVRNEDFEKFIEKIDTFLEQDKETINKILETSGSAFANNDARQVIRNMISHVSAGLAFSHVDIIMLVWDRQKFLFATKNHFDILKPYSISQGIMKYVLSDEARKKFEEVVI